MEHLLKLAKEAPELDLYAHLQKTEKPILIYGMGDGAAKLIYALSQKGIAYRDIFASDEFVRGQVFLGQRVKTFSQCQALYGDCIVLVAFSSFLPAVIEKVEQIATQCELYVPDISVYGDPSELFDTSFFLDHLKKFQEVLLLLANEASKRFFLALLRYKLSGRLCDLWKLEEESLDYSAQIKNVFTYCDLGAYNGDTLAERKELNPEVETAIAFEPEARNFRKLQSLNGRFSRCIWVQAAATDTVGLMEFANGKGRGSSRNALDIPGLRSAKAKEIPTDTLDHAVKEHKIPKVDLIKYDVEGCEYEALQGSKNTITTQKPALIVSLYHNHNDLYKLPLLLKSYTPEGKFYLSRKRKCFPAWEVELTIIQ